jgi:hypothetical protein
MRTAPAAFCPTARDRVPRSKLSRNSTSHRQAPAGVRATVPKSVGTADAWDQVISTEPT